MEYWFADYFGRAWFRGRRSAVDERLADCRTVAHGGTLPAGRLWAVQTFTARAWFLVAMGSAVLIGVIAIAGSPIPMGGWRSALADLILVLGNVIAISGAQMGMINYRRAQTARYVLRGGPFVAARPSQAARGIPRQRDFWIMLAVALAGSALIFYSKTHPSA
jgi:hypothetical protein